MPAAVTPTSIQRLKTALEESVRIPLTPDNIRRIGQSARTRLNRKRNRSLQGQLEAGSVKEAVAAPVLKALQFMLRPARATAIRAAVGGTAGYTGAAYAADEAKLRSSESYLARLAGLYAGALGGMAFRNKFTGQGGLGLYKKYLLDRARDGALKGVQLRPGAGWLRNPSGVVHTKNLNELLMPLTKDWSTQGLKGLGTYAARAVEVPLSAATSALGHGVARGLNRLSVALGGKGERAGNLARLIFHLAGKSKLEPLFAMAANGDRAVAKLMSTGLRASLGGVVAADLYQKYTNPKNDIHNALYNLSPKIVSTFSDNPADYKNWYADVARDKTVVGDAVRRAGLQHAGKALIQARAGWGSPWRSFLVNSASPVGMDALVSQAPRITNWLAGTDRQFIDQAAEKAFKDPNYLNIRKSVIAKNFNKILSAKGKYQFSDLASAALKLPDVSKRLSDMGLPSVAAALGTTAKGFLGGEASDPKKLTTQIGEALAKDTNAVGLAASLGQRHLTDAGVGLAARGGGGLLGFAGGAAGGVALADALMGPEPESRRNKPSGSWRPTAKFLGGALGGALGAYGGASLGASLVQPS